MKTARQILLDAADLLEKPGQWTQYTAARDMFGSEVYPLGADAACWCMMGALHKVADVRWSEMTPAGQELKAVLGEDSIANFNDRSTQAEVVAKLREAANRLDRVPAGFKRPEGL